MTKCRKHKIEREYDMKYDEMLCIECERELYLMAKSIFYTVEKRIPISGYINGAWTKWWIIIINVKSAIITLKLHILIDSWKKCILKHIIKRN